MRALRGVSFDPARDLVMGHEFCAEVAGLRPRYGARVRTRHAGVLGAEPRAEPADDGRRLFARRPGGYGERMV